MSPPLHKKLIVKKSRLCFTVISSKHILAMDKYNQILKATDPLWVPLDPLHADDSAEDSLPDLTVVSSPQLPPEPISPITSSTRVEPPAKPKPKPKQKTKPKPKLLESSDEDEFGITSMSKEQRYALFLKLQKKVKSTQVCVSYTQLESTFISEQTIRKFGKSCCYFCNISLVGGFCNN